MPVAKVAHTRLISRPRRAMMYTSSKGSKPIRNIERQMNEAITASKDWRLDNTEVTNEGGVSTVTLHGNKIAEVGDTWLRIYDGGYRSVTTKSRLNAILRAHGNGEGVYQKKYEWFFYGVNGERPFESGLLLD
jgi:hypothetical protein